MMQKMSVNTVFGLDIVGGFGFSERNGWITYYLVLILRKATCVHHPQDLDGTHDNNKFVSLY